LPDIDSLEVLIEVPQAESQGFAVGQRVRVHPLGRPDQVIESKLEWISASAQARNQENPARYITARALIPAELAREFRLVPGQRMAGRVELLASEKGISVSNTAVLDAGGRSVVHVREGNRFVAKTVELGRRSNSRSQVLSGLNPGDLVRLVPPRAQSPPVEAGRAKS